MNREGDIVALGLTIDAAWARAVSERGLEKQVLRARGYQCVAGVFALAEHPVAS